MNEGEFPRRFLKDVYYGGSEAGWKNISIDIGNNFSVATIHYALGSADTSQSSTLGVGTKLLKLSSAKKAVIVKWKKASKEKLKKISGYQIQIATDSGFKSIVKTVAVSKKETSKKIKGLAKKTNYYVRIRAYKGSNVGSWSDVGKVKIK